jgi:hypothetical protein
LELRVLVLTLGEASHAGWWRSQFLSSVGLNTLEWICPRSRFATAVRAASQAARLVHDSNIGVGSVAHLFRLPQDWEYALESALRENEDALRKKLSPLLGDWEKLMEALQNLAGPIVDQPPTVGPVHLGDLHHDWLPQCTATYYTAFQARVKTFPYFEVHESSPLQRLKRKSEDGI